MWTISQNLGTLDDSFVIDLPLTYFWVNPLKPDKTIEWQTSTGDQDTLETMI